MAEPGSSNRPSEPSGPLDIVHPVHPVFATPLETLHKDETLVFRHVLHLHSGASLKFRNIIGLHMKSCLKTLNDRYALFFSFHKDAKEMTSECNHIPNGAARIPTNRNKPRQQKCGGGVAKVVHPHCPCKPYTFAQERTWRRGERP